MTGGFRSAKGMAQAIEDNACQSESVLIFHPSNYDSVNFFLCPLVVGLARPICSEPFFCRDILAGKTERAKENKIPNALQTPAACIQIAAIATDKPIPDLSDEKVAQEIQDMIMGGGKKEEKPVKEQDISNY